MDMEIHVMTLPESVAIRLKNPCLIIVTCHNNPKMTSKVSAAIIGGGVIANSHAQWLRASATCELHSIVDPFETGRALAQKSSVPCFDSLENLLESSKNRLPDIYLVCVPSGLHVPIATNILNKASPKVILVEKPFSTDSESGAGLIALAQQKGVKIAVGHHRRFNHYIAAHKKLIASGKLGQITAISSLWTCKKSDTYYSVAPWRASRAKGGGPIWTNLVHDIDALHYLIGSEVKRLWAKSTVRRREHPDVAADDVVEEGAAVILEFENGVIGTLLLCDNVASPYGWESATGETTTIMRNGTDLDSYRIFGTQGTLSGPDGLVWRYEDQGEDVGWGLPMTKETLQHEQWDSFQKQIEHLGRVAKGLEEPVCPGKAGLAAVRACEAICEAIEKPENGPVELWPTRQ